MQPALEHYDIGVIIGRFQVHELHDSHRDLLLHVRGAHDKVLVLLGTSPLPVSSNNPLDFEARKQMLLDEFPGLTVLYVKDQPSDEVWSRKVDEILRDTTMPGQSVILYGSRDSFIGHYSGRFPTRELMAESFLSGTAVRKKIARGSTRNSPEFRAGVIWASQARFPTVFTTVDVAVLHEDGRILLGRKPNEKLFRFIGGFSDPNTKDFVFDAKREVFEETGLSVEDVKYVGSCEIDDWRYRNEPDCIRTLFFTAKYTHGAPTPQDDIEEVRWFEREFVNRNTVISAHHPLIALLHKELLP